MYAVDCPLRWSRVITAEPGIISLLESRTVSNYHICTPN